MSMSCGFLRPIGLALAVLAGLGAGRVQAEELVVTLSTREVAITSTYTGAEITIFGLIERDSNTISRAGVYEIVVNVQGPRGEVVVQQKDRLGPIWLTASRRRFSKVPLFYSVLSGRPLSEVTDERTRKQLGLGLKYNLPDFVTDDPVREAIEDGFRDAVVRIRMAEGAFIVDEKAVTMVRPNLFSARVTLPATAPVGLYIANITILSEGVPLRTVQAGFVVRKVGFDAFVANSARNDSWSYALVTILMALGMGWIANVVFRRD